MSLLCSVDNCMNGAEIECDCENINRFCRFHFLDHSESKGCIRYRDVPDQVKADFKIAMIMIKELDRKDKELMESSHIIINRVKKYLAKLHSDIKYRKDKASKVLINGGCV